MNISAIILLGGFVLFGSLGAVRAQVPAGAMSDLATNPMAKGADTNFDKVIPEIRFNSVPLTFVIENLTGQAEINYQIDARCRWGAENPEPVINGDFENVRPKDLLVHILDTNGLALEDDPITTVAWITKKRLPLKTVNYDLLVVGKDNPRIPLIKFSDVPMDVALGNLATQAGGNLFVSHDIDGVDDEMLSVRWQNITARQAIIAICENYDLSFATNNTPGAVYIVQRPKIK